MAGHNNICNSLSKDCQSCIRSDKNDETGINGVDGTPATGTVMARIKTFLN